MTNFNDGEIHLWKGGTCPVNPKTKVKVWLRTQNPRDGGVGRSNEWTWSHSGICPEDDIIAFRVIEEFKEPEVIWVNYTSSGPAWTHSSENSARNEADDPRFCVVITKKFIEVQE